ncbi:TonB-dependent receptor [Altererythrobacter salegens]|uniref:TonB-dependent receptor n=2 Tax=Croceibacterium salegens TaxID=1737568 RepID=A0A6I4SWB8_9SPHN|nr:TonB-dependent receptor [Croceibacterium salegens]
MLKICGGRLAGASLAALAFVMSGPAAAQDDAASDEQAQKPADSGNQIIVYGLRREDTLQDTPAAITAFDAEAIENAGIDKPADFINLTSNVNLVETQNVGNAFIVIRGITQARNSEPSVAVVIDGVQQVNAAAFNQDLFDIAQIEVLKGPQGALYGRNAIGGAIIITTKQPSDQLEGSITAGIDNGFGYYTRAGISGPLSDGIKFRIAGLYKDTDGYIPNPYLGREADPYKDYALRGSLLFDAGGGFSADLRASLDRTRTTGFWYNIVGDVNDTSLPVRVNNEGIDNRDMNNVSAKLTYESDDFTITSVTSYDTVKEIITGDAFDFLPTNEAFCALPSDPCFSGSTDLNQSQYLNVKAFSQELRVESPADEDLFWMVGGYLISTDRFISTGNMLDLDKGVFPVYRTPSTNADNPQYSFLSDSQDNFAWAAFANLGYKISDMVRVDASVRYDHDRRRNTTETPNAWLGYINYIAFLFGAPQSAQGDVRTRNFSDWQPKFTVTVTPNSDLTFYGGYSRGFRSGGFNQTGVGVVAAANGVVGVNDVFEAETADTWELGFKSQLADGLFTVNGSIYTTESKNSYFFVYLYANSTQNLGNVPKVRLKGLELEALVTPTDDLQFNVAWGLTGSEIKEFPDPAAIGNEAPVVSRSTLNFGAQFTPYIGGEVSALLRADYRRIGRTWWDVYNSTVRRPVELVDVRAGVKGDHWSLTGFASNLFNEKYNAEFSPGGFVFKARPRIFGVEAGYNF